MLVALADVVAIKVDETLLTRLVYNNCLKQQIILQLYIAMQSYRYRVRHTTNQKCVTMHWQENVGGLIRRESKIQKNVASHRV